MRYPWLRWLADGPARLRRGADYDVQSSSFAQAGRAWALRQGGRISAVIGSDRTGDYVDMVYYPPKEGS